MFYRLFFLAVIALPLIQDKATWRLFKFSRQRKVKIGLDFLDFLEKAVYSQL